MHIDIISVLYIKILDVVRHLAKGMPNDMLYYLVNRVDMLNVSRYAYVDSSARLVSCIQCSSPLYLVIFIPFSLPCAVLC